MFSNSTNKNRNIRIDFKILAQDNLLCRIEGQDQELAKGGEDEVSKLKQLIFDENIQYSVRTTHIIPKIKISRDL